VALRCATSEAIWRSGHARRWCALSDCGGSRQKPNDRWRGDVAGFDVGVDAALLLCKA
jgi:hypothetical protein